MAAQEGETLVADRRADPAALAPPAQEKQAAPVAAATNPPPPPPSRSLKRALFPVLAITIVIGLVVLVSTRWDSWLAGLAVQRTDDAFIRSDVSQLSARVSGNVLRVGVHDFQTVKRGELLVEIDPRDYLAAVAQAEANVAAAQATLDNLANQKAEQAAAIAQAEAQSASAVAREILARQESDRQAALLHGPAGTQQGYDTATSNLNAAIATHRAADATADTARRQLDVLAGQQGLLAANVDAAKAALQTAQLRLGYTTIVAPFDGIVGQRQVQPEDYVNVGTNLIAVVPLPSVYIIANYKETQLSRVRPGQPVEISVDTFPGKIFTGRVARTSPASGSTFALLPPDNATGNFTKVVQRIPVRIEFEPDQPGLDSLRAGMSVETRIHVD